MKTCEPIFNLSKGIELIKEQTLDTEILYTGFQEP